MKAKRILITGASGFVGRHLVDHLLASTDRHLRLAVRKRRSCPDAWARNDRIEILETGAIETFERLDAAVRDVYAICHLAGLAHTPRASNESFIAANALATERLVAATMAQETSIFVHLSSLAAITSNASNSVIDDDTNEPPPSPYGASKKLAEDHVAVLAGNGALAVSLRPPLIVGADARGNWSALQSLAASGLPLPFANSTSRRSYVSVATIVEAIGQLCQDRWDSKKSGNYCIADTDVLTLAEVITNLRKGMGMSQRLVPFPLGMIRRLGAALGREQAINGLLGSLHVDASRFNKTFDFVAPQPLQEAIIASGRQCLLDRAKNRSEVIQ